MNMDETKLRKDYFEYNPDEDYNMKKGTEIAEKVFKRCGYNFDNLSKWVILNRLSYLAEKMSEEK